MKALALLLLLGAQHEPRYAFPGADKDGLLAFTVALPTGWRPKLSGPKGDAADTPLLEPKFYGPKGSTLTLIRQKDLGDDFMRAVVEDLDRAQTRDPEGFRKLAFDGWFGGFYLVSRRGKPRVEGRLIRHSEVLTVGVECVSPFGPAEMTSLEKLLLSLR